MTESRRVKAVVYKANTLGFIENGSIWVLNSITLNGCRPFRDEVIMSPQKHDYRMATLKDFDTLRVRYHEQYIVGE